MKDIVSADSNDDRCPMSAVLAGKTTWFDFKIADVDLIVVTVTAEKITRRVV